MIQVPSLLSRSTRGVLIMNCKDNIDLSIFVDKSQKKYDYSDLCQGKKKVIVIGIGGGSDIVGTYAIALVLSKRNPKCEIMYGLCVSPKERYDGFKEINSSLYQRKKNIKNIPIDKLHHSLRLLIQMAVCKNDLMEPFLIVRPKKASFQLKRHFVKLLMN